MTKHVAPRRPPRTGPECDWRHPQTSGQVYLDYTGAALYPEALLREHTEILARQLFGNPHSVHRASQASTFAGAVAREALLHFLDADPRLRRRLDREREALRCGWRFEAFPLFPRRRSFSSPTITTASTGFVSRRARAAHT